MGSQFACYRIVIHIYTKCKEGSTPSFLSEFRKDKLLYAHIILILSTPTLLLIVINKSRKQILRNTTIHIKMGS